MSFPPIIEDLVYRKTMAGDLDSGLPLTSGAHSTNDSVTYGFARWQPQFLFLKLGHNTDVSQNGNQPGQEIDAKLGDDYWMVSPNGLISHWNDGTRDRDALRKKPSLVFDHHEKGQTIERVKAAHIAS